MKVKSLRYSKKPVGKTASDKQVKVTVTKHTYVQLLGDVEKYPMSMRVAAELWRAGVKLERFENEFHFEDNGFSKRVYEHIVNWHLGKGLDPLRVPPVRPVYLRYMSPMRALEERSPVGRPTEQQVVDFLRKIMEEKEKKGWKELDFFKAFRVLDSDEDAPIKVKQSKEDEEPPTVKVVKRRLPAIHHVLVGSEWKEAATRAAVEKLKVQALDLSKVLPVEEPKKLCVWCKFPLGSVVITTRTEKNKCSHMHLSCFYMNEVVPSTLTVGMRVLSPTEGCWYEWQGIPDGKGKGGWIKLQSSQTVEKTTEAVSSPGVPQPSGKESKSPVSLATPTPP